MPSRDNRMEADFLDAHERHWNDAEMLFTAQAALR